MEARDSTKKKQTEAKKKDRKGCHHLYSVFLPWLILWLSKKKAILSLSCFSLPLRGRSCASIHIKNKLLWFFDEDEIKEWKERKRHRVKGKFFSFCRKRKLFMTLEKHKTKLCFKKLPLLLYSHDIIFVFHHQLSVWVISLCLCGDICSTPTTERKREAVLMREKGSDNEHTHTWTKKRDSYWERRKMTFKRKLMRWLQIPMQ